MDSDASNDDGKNAAIAYFLSEDVEFTRGSESFRVIDFSSPENSAAASVSVKSATSFPATGFGKVRTILTIASPPNLSSPSGRYKRNW